MSGDLVSLSAPRTDEQLKITNYNENKNNFSMYAPSHDCGGSEFGVGRNYV